MTHALEYEHFTLTHYLIELAGEGNGIRDDFLRVTMLDQSPQFSLALVSEPLTGSFIDCRIFHCQCSWESRNAGPHQFSALNFTDTGPEVYYS